MDEGNRQHAVRANPALEVVISQWGDFYEIRQDSQFSFKARRHGSVGEPMITQDIDALIRKMAEDFRANPAVVFEGRPVPGE